MLGDALLDIDDAMPQQMLQLEQDNQLPCSVQAVECYFHCWALLMLRMKESMAAPVVTHYGSTRG
jgi:hypothetical protein